MLSALACRNGDGRPASEVARWVGFQNRYQLARLLRHDGLPPLEQLAGWTRVLYWLQEAESTGISLLRLAHREGLDPAAAYRLVRRTTSMRWSEARRVGTAALLARLRDRCHARAARARFRTRAGRQTPAPTAGKGAVVPVSVAAGRAGSATLRSVPGRHPDAATVRRLPLAGCPFDVGTVLADFACVTCHHRAVVECVGLTPLRSLGSIRVGAVPTRILCTRATALAYVANQFDDAIGVIDLERRRQTTSIRVPGNPMSAALGPDGRTLYVTTNLDRLCAVWPAQGRVAGVVSIPQGCTHISIHPSGRSLYVSTAKTGNIVEVDVRSLRTLRTFTVGGNVQDVAVSADGVTLFAANEDGWVDVIHLATGRHTARVPSLPRAFGLALSRDDGVLYVSMCGVGRVAVIDTHTLGLLATLNTGGRPRRMAVDVSGRNLVMANEAGWVDLVR